MDYQIDYFSEEVEEEILSLPDTLAARYVVLTRRMIAIGSNLGPPHTDSFGDGLFESWRVYSPPLAAFFASGDLREL